MALTTVATTDDIDFSGTPAEIVAQVFELAWAKSEEASSSSDAKFNAALLEGSNVPAMIPSGVGFIPEVIEPNVNIPINAEGASLARFNEVADAVIDKLAGLFSGYMEAYFPDDCGYLEKAQQWICDALTAGGTGMNPVVEDQIWQRDRARILQDANRVEQEIMATFAARRFPLPPGAAAHAVLLNQQEAQAKIAQASRDVAIKQAEIEIENVRFAVDKAINLYTAAIGAASDYIRALSIGPQAGMQLIPSITDSQSRLIGAASEYYRARIAVEDLKLKARTPDAEFAQQAKIQNGNWVMQMIKNKVDAAIEAAKGLSTQAAAALNGLHATSSIGASSNNTVGYSYGGDVNDEVSPKISA